jgi:hypothetical protein
MFVAQRCGAFENPLIELLYFRHRFLFEAIAAV